MIIHVLITYLIFSECFFFPGLSVITSNNENVLTGLCCNERISPLSRLCNSNVVTSLIYSQTDVWKHVHNNYYTCILHWQWRIQMDSSTPGRTSRNDSLKEKDNNSDNLEKRRERCASSWEVFYFDTNVCALTPPPHKRTREPASIQLWGLAILLSGLVTTPTDTCTNPRAHTS